MPTDRAYLQLLAKELQSKNVAFEPGLSDDEVSQIEHTYEFRFPPDLRDLLQFALPISEEFPNWRKGWIAQPIIEWQDRLAVRRGHKLVSIDHQLAWPADSICFDVERNDFWMDARGPKSKDLHAALNVAREKLAGVPTLIPIYSHRYIPSEPCISGNPVFSVYQTDIIYYGFDLASYFANEFKISSPEWAATEARNITFWSTLAG